MFVKVGRTLSGYSDCKVGESQHSIKAPVQMGSPSPADFN